VPDLSRFSAKHWKKGGSMNYFSDSISFYVTKDMKKALQKISRRNEENLSATIRKILKENIFNREKKAKVGRVDL
jgi:tartrate dehydratase alpha subunit/fumarate hydratase class I-like protein